MEKNIIRNIIEQEPEIIHNGSLFRTRLAEQCPGEELLCELIAMAYEEGIPYRMKAEKSDGAEEYAVQIADLFGCTEKTAMAVAKIWLAAMPAIPEKREYPGRRKCDTLKAIRKKIAEANAIPYYTEVCSHEGPCRGTCPKCDAEIEYLNRELQKKMDRGEEVILEGLGISDIDTYEEAVQSIAIKQPREYSIKGSDSYEPVLSEYVGGFMNIPEGIDEELPFE